MDKAKFFSSLRARGSGVFGTSLSQGQVSGTEMIVDEAQRRGVSLPHLAYILATAYHETAHTMQPVREMGGEKYLRSKKYYPWVGEGLVQVTWEDNHRKFGATKPGQMMTWPIALVAIFDGMLKGIFTGKKLSDYIGDGKTDYVGARRIVNGTDKAALIAGYAKAFEKALRDAGYLGQAPKPSPVPPAPQPLPPADDPVVSVPPAKPAAVKEGWVAVLVRMIVGLFKR